MRGGFFDVFVNVRRFVDVFLFRGVLFAFLQMMSFVCVSVYFCVCVFCNTELVKHGHKANKLECWNWGTKSALLVDWHLGSGK